MTDDWIFTFYVAFMLAYTGWGIGALLKWYQEQTKIYDKIYEDFCAALESIRTR